MSETTDVVQTTEVLAREQASYQLVATDEKELRAAHKDMIAWAVDRQLMCESERAEVAENLRVAKENGWRVEPFKKRLPVLDRRKAFYAKIEAALRAGYVIVPNFQMTVFAIRTDADSPRGETNFAGAWSPERFVQRAKMLELGEGEYKNPLPALLETQTQVDDGKGGKTTRTTRWADEFKMLNFPLALAKPMLMERTATAMAGKVFDEVGVAEDTQWSPGKGDPIILGRIRNPRRNHPDITFFIGWYFDPSNI